LWLTDEKPPEQWIYSTSISPIKKWLETGAYSAAILNGADMVIPSPGIPPYNEILTAAVLEKIPVISEIELAFRFLKKPVIAVTGTNGKTTTVKPVGRNYC